MLFSEKDGGEFFFRSLSTDCSTCSWVAMKGKHKRDEMKQVTWRSDDGNLKAQWECLRFPFHMYRTAYNRPSPL